MARSTPSATTTPAQKPGRASPNCWGSRSSRMKRGFWGGAVLLLVGGLLAWWAAGSRPAVAQDKKETPSDKEARDQLLETVGVLAASQLYQGYLNIGFVADG